MSQRKKEKVRKNEAKCPCCDGYGTIQIFENDKVEEMVDKKVKIAELEDQVRKAKEEG